MPSSKNYVRDYKQERKTAIKRKETNKGKPKKGAGKSQAGDSKRHRARAALEKKLGRKLKKGEHAGHGKGKLRNKKGDPKTKVESASKNMSKGGKAGSKKGKAAGGRKGKK